jgi:hypothetical protein
MELFIDALYWTATAAVALAFATGLGLLLAPTWLREHTRPLDFWHSLRPATGPLEKPRYVEGRLYHHHRLLGFLLVCGSAYTLLRLAMVDSQTMQAVLPTHWDRALREISATSAYWFLGLSSVAALGVGCAVFFRPSLLKSLEAGSNRWLSTRQAAKPMDVYHNGADVWLWRHSRATGIFLLLGSVYIWGVLLAYRHGVL